MYFLPDMGQKELLQVIDVHAKEKNIKIDRDIAKKFARRVLTFSGTPAHVSYSFLPKEEGSTFTLEDIERVPTKLNDLIVDVIKSLDESSKRIMKAYRFYYLLNKNKLTLIFKELLKLAFARLNGYSEIEFNKGLKHLMKIGLIHESGPELLSAPKEGFLEAITLGYRDENFDRLKKPVVKDFLKAMNRMNLDVEEYFHLNLAGLTDSYQWAKIFGISELEFIDLAIQKNPRLGSRIAMIKIFNEDIQHQKELCQKITKALGGLEVKDQDDYFYLGGAHSRLNEFKKAKSCFESSLKLNPENKCAQCELGMTHLRLGNYGEALEKLKKTTEIDPKDTSAWARLGLIYTKLKNYKKAKKCLEEAVELEPKNAYAFYRLGHVFDKLDMHEEAIEQVQHAINIDPKYNDYLGQLYARREDYEKAKKCLKKALEIDPKNVVVYYNRGILYVNLKKYEEALADYTKAIKLDPKNTAAYYNKACLYALKKEKDKLIENLKMAIQLDSKYKEDAKKDDDFKAYWNKKWFKELTK